MPGLQCEPQIRCGVIVWLIQQQQRRFQHPFLRLRRSRQRLLIPSPRQQFTELFGLLVMLFQSSNRIFQTRPIEEPKLWSSIKLAKVVPNDSLLVSTRNQMAQRIPRQTLLMRI